MKLMKIAFIANSIVPKSSIGRVILNLAKEFKQKGHKIQIYTINYNAHFIKEYGIEEAEIFCHKYLKIMDKLNGIPILGFILTIIKFNLWGFLLIPDLKKRQPDIINSHHFFCGISGNIVSKFVRVPHVLTVHGINLSKEDLNTILFWSIQSILDFLKNQVPFIISVDPRLKTSPRFAQISDRIEIIFPCLDVQHIRFLKDVKPVLNISERKKLIYVGRLERRKGLDELFYSLAKAKHYWSELKVVGAGSYEKRLKKLAKKLEMLDNVKFFGFKEGLDKIKLMDDSEILLSFSKSEGFPLVILEYFALGKPCIIYPISPFSDEKGKLNALGIKFMEEKLGMFLKTNPNYLLEILQSSKLAELFTQERYEARKQFAQDFYPEKVTDEYLKFFKFIIKLNGKRSMNL